MPIAKTESNITDVHNWPNLFFKFILGVLGMLLIYVSSGLVAEIKEFRTEMGNFRKELIGNGKDFQYLKEDFVELKGAYLRHIEQSESEKRELNRKIEELRYQLKNQ